MQTRRIVKGSATEKCKFCGTKWDLTKAKANAGDGNGKGGGKPPRGNKGKKVRDDEEWENARFLEKLADYAAKFPGQASVVETIKRDVQPPTPPPKDLNGQLQQASNKRKGVQSRLEKSMANEERLAKELDEAKQKSATLVTELYDANAEMVDLAEKVKKSIGTKTEKEPDKKTNLFDLFLGNPDEVEFSFGDALDGVDEIVVASTDKAEFETLQKKVVAEIRSLLKNAFAPLHEAVAKGGKEMQDHVAATKKRKLDEQSTSATAAPAAATATPAAPAGATATSGLPAGTSSDTAAVQANSDGDQDMAKKVADRLDKEKHTRQTRQPG